MHRDIQPNEIEWVFCWRTSEGGGAAGVLYRPEVRGPESLSPRTLSPRTLRDPKQPDASLVPARNLRELEILQDGARKAVAEGRASDWTLAAIGARKQVRWAVCIAAKGADDGTALAAAVAELTRSLKTPWTLRIEEDEMVHVDREGRETAILMVDTMATGDVIPGAGVSFPGVAVTERWEQEGGKGGRFVGGGGLV